MQTHIINRTYIVRHKNAEDIEYKNYRKAIRVAVSMCGIDYPVLIVRDGIVLHTLILNDFGIIVDKINTRYNEYPTIALTELREV